MTMAALSPIVLICATSSSVRSALLGGAAVSPLGPLLKTCPAMSWRAWSATVEVGLARVWLPPGKAQAVSPMASTAESAVANVMDRMERFMMPPSGHDRALAQAYLLARPDGRQRGLQLRLS